MAIFETSEQLYGYINELFAEIATLPEARVALKTVKLSVQFNYTAPDLYNNTNSSEWRVSHYPWGV